MQYVKCSHDFCDVKMTASQTPLKPEFGQSANLTVTFEGSEKVTYEWKKGAEELGPPAATERFSQYNVPADLPISSTPYEYTCTVRQGGAVIATAEFSVKVEPKSISGAQVTLDRENITLSDNPADNKVTVTAVEPDGKKLVEGVDYTVAPDRLQCRGDIPSGSPASEAMAEQWRRKCWSGPAIRWMLRTRIRRSK